MFRHISGSLARCLVWSVLILAGLLQADIVWAETPCQAASESPDFDERLTPLRIKLSGFVNTRPEASSLGFVKLEIRSYQVTAYFEVVTAEAVDCPQATEGVLLQQIKKRGHFPLVGAKDLLLKVATAAPGTPLTLDGYYRPRNRNLHVKHVEIIGMTN
jgi:hypothetical protein